MSQRNPRLIAIRDHLSGIFEIHLKPIFVKRNTEDRYEDLFNERNLEIFAQGFTSDMISRANYESYETLGDVVIADVFLHMCEDMGFRRSREMTNLHNTLCACVKQAELSNSLGLMKLVNKSQLFMDDNSLAEDLLEALVGTLEHVLKNIFEDRFIAMPYLHGFVESIYKSQGWNYAEEAKKNVMQLLKEYIETKHDKQIPFYRHRPRENPDINGNVTVSVLFNDKKNGQWCAIVLGTAIVRVKNRDTFEDSLKLGRYLAAQNAINKLNITETDIEQMRKERNNIDKIQPIIRRVTTLIESASFTDFSLSYDSKKLVVFASLRDKEEDIPDDADSDNTIFSIFRMQKLANEGTTSAYERLLNVILLTYNNKTVDEIRTSILSVRHNLNMNVINTSQLIAGHTGSSDEAFDSDISTVHVDNEVDSDMSRILRNRLDVRRNMVDANSTRLTSLVSTSSRGHRNIRRGTKGNGVRHHSTRGGGTERNTNTRNSSEHRF